MYGAERPKEGANERKTPTFSDAQATALPEAPARHTLKGKRDRAVLAVFFFHAVRRAELCALRVKDYGGAMRPIQIIFSLTSVAELTRMPRELQLQILGEFRGLAQQVY